MKFYINSDKSDARNQLENQGISRDDIDIHELQYVGYEVEFDIIFENGDVYATHVNGTKLTKPVVL